MGLRYAGSQKRAMVLNGRCPHIWARDAKYAIECGDTAFSAPFRKLLLRAIAMGSGERRWKDTRP